MSGAKQLNVGSRHGRSSLRKRENVVEVQFIDRAANGAFGAISFPDFELDVRRDDAPSFGVYVDGLLEVVIPLNSDQFELADRAKFVAFGPGIYEVEDAVV